MILATTKTISEIPHLATFMADKPNAVVGWGRKTSGRRAIWLSKLLRRPLALLEDGFVRSIERHAPTLSLLVDDVGVYYDASRPSRMEQIIADGVDPARGLRARALAKQWREGAISKYNHAPEYVGPLPARYVLVVDQTSGDLSVAGGLAEARSFPKMLAAALNENHDQAVVVKIHPDVHTRAKTSNFSLADLHHPRVHVIDADCHCASLIRDASSVYCVTSLMGFEAMLWEKPVRCFGMPFYAGWGLSHDELRAPPRRHHHAEMDDLIHGALLGIAKYAAPDTGEAWEAEQAIAHTARGRAALLARFRAPAST